MVLALKNIARVGQMSVRQFASNAPKGDIHPGYFKFKETQKLYQKEDGIPVHLKRGTRDKVLYYATFGLCGLGLAGCLQFFYEMAQK